ncbi:two-component regulator propeller domain-containing protein [Aquabacterium sp.]|uniref:two-component regulator propeller domain-containing protein n=1 Tax=Aquabacterium sp. TaxID=1872578 RepID=UPI0037839E47
MTLLASSCLPAWRRWLLLMLSMALPIWLGAQPVLPAPNVPASGSLDPARPALSQFKIDRWQTEQGLPLNTVQAMLQARDGTLWVGTGGGLARFDGLRFSTFEDAPVTELASGPIFGFMEDAQGALWIGHSLGATRYRAGRFERVFTDEQMEGRRVWAFAQGRDGVVWSATENGLVRWDKGAVRIFKEADGLPTNRLRTLAFDKDGTLWIGTTGGGLVSYAGGRFQVFNPSNGFPHLEVRQVLADPAGGLWAATAGAGLVRVQDGHFTIYTTANGLPTNHLTALARDTAGALWVGSWGAGISRMVGEGRFETLSSSSGLDGDQIWALHADREGSLWVGTWYGGLNRLRPRPFIVFGKPEGLSSDNVRSVLPARDGSLWLATAGGGVNRLANGRISLLGRQQGLRTDETSGLFEDRDGAIWIGTYTEGLARWRDGRLEHFGVAQGLPHVDVRVLYQDRQGTLWVGTKGGLARFDGQGFVAVRGNGVPIEGVAAILEDRSGTLWFGTTGQGLVRLRNGEFQTFTRKDGLASNWIMALYEDADGSLWIGSNGEGLSRLRDGRIRSIRVTDGLWDGMAQVILEDRQGNLWMTCNRGFYRVKRTELDAFVEGRVARVQASGYGPGDALRSTTFAGGLQPAGAIDAQGRLWLPSFRGLVIADPARLPGAGDPPPVRIDEVRVGGQRVPHDTELVLPPGPAPLLIRYLAGTLADAERVRLRYRLEGLTPGWVEAGKAREASFAALPPGRYVFSLAVSLDGQRWQDAPQALHITVQPRLVQTPWFIALVALALLLAAAALYKLRTHALRRRSAEMERLVAQKTEELRQANEHLSRLSFADALTGLANRRRLDEVLDTEWRRAQRMQTPLAVVIADIDAFKAYNDTLGHPEGDACLVAVAEVIRQAANRASDFAARYGGEEFILLLPGADAEAARAFAEVLRQACEARALPHPASSVSPVVTLSLGVAACVPTAESSSAALVAAADGALYRAKQEGRNRVCVAAAVVR